MTGHHRIVSAVVIVWVAGLIPTVGYARLCAFVGNQGRDTIARVDLERGLFTPNSPLTAVSCEIGPPPLEVGVASFATTADGRLFIKTASCAVLPYDIASAERSGYFMVSQQRWDGDIAVRADGAAFFTPASDHTVVAYVGWDRTEIEVGSFPSAVALSPDEGTLYVANSGQNIDGQPDSISLVDTATLVVRATIPVGDRPVSLAASHDGTRLYVGHEVPGVVSVIDTAAGAVITSYEIAEAVGQIVLAGDAETLYVQRLRYDSVLNRVGVVAANAASGEVTARSDLAASYLAVGPDGSLYALVGEEVVRLDGQTLAVQRRIRLGDCGCGGYFELCVAPCYRQRLAVAEVPDGCGMACGGDCNGDSTVTIDELVTAVNIALGMADVQSCAACDANDNGELTVEELVGAVAHALTGCPQLWK